MLSRFGRVLLAAAFLAAQAAGVAHQVWHDAAPAVAHADEATSDGKAPQKSFLCDFHTALSTVLGAVAGGSHVAPLDTQVALSFLAADVPAQSLSSLAPRSRGPPTLL